MFNEPAAAQIEHQLNGTTLFAPYLLKAELSSIAWKKARQSPASNGLIMTALRMALSDTRIVWSDVDPIDAALVALETGTTAYDASYLWLAGHLGADVITLDRRLMAASADRR